MTTLAEPNLTATNGQPASFLAGGEFPVPVASDDGTTAFRRSRSSSRQFGVSLDVTPTIIDRRASEPAHPPEVSQLSNTGAVSRRSQRRRFTIPALTVRRAETTVELGSGQSFVLAGLLQNTVHAEHLEGSVARRHPGPRPVVPLGAVPAQRDRTGHHRHALSRQAGRNGQRAGDADGRASSRRMTRSVHQRRDLPSDSCPARRKRSDRRPAAPGTGRPGRLPAGLREGPAMKLHPLLSLRRRPGARRLPALRRGIHRKRSAEGPAARQRARRHVDRRVSRRVPAASPPATRRGCARWRPPAASQPSDRVLVATGGPPGARSRRASMRLPPSCCPTASSPSPLPVPVVPPNQAIVESVRYVVTLPPCPNWSKRPPRSISPTPHASNFGCADAVNLGQMVAQPGRSGGAADRSGRADGHPAAAAVQRYLTDKVVAAGRSRHSVRSRQQPGNRQRRPAGAGTQLGVQP